MIRPVKSWGALVGALVMLSATLAGAVTVTDMGLWGVQSVAAVNNFFQGGCDGSPSPCTAVTSAAATSYNWIGQAVRIDQVNDGDTTEWHFINPDGTSTITWSRFHAANCSGCTPGCCWEDSTGSSTCGAICNTPTFAQYMWVTNQYWCRAPKPGYRVEIWNNGAVALSKPFSLQHDPTGNLGITSPEDDRISYSPFHLVEVSQSNFTSAIAPFSAGTNLSGSTINWSVTTQYATTGWAGADPQPTQFSTTNGEQRNQTYQNLGGQVQVQARIAAFGTTITDCATTYIEGPESGIPDPSITARVSSLYQSSPNHGPTPNLLTGAVWRESGYHQFMSYPLQNQEDLFSTSAFGLNPKFPTESPQGALSRGAFIGLMQVPTTNPHAWNWETNTNDGVNIFSGPASDNKMSRAIQLWADSIAGVSGKKVVGHTGMQPLSGDKNEDNALMLYGGFVKDFGGDETKALAELYWVPKCDGSTTKQGNKLTCNAPNGWYPIENPSTAQITMDGIAYAKGVRADGK